LHTFGFLLFRKIVTRGYQESQAQSAPGKKAESGWRVTLGAVKDDLFIAEPAVK
jgi:hypothetical protein